MLYMKHGSGGTRGLPERPLQQHFIADVTQLLVTQCVLLVLLIGLEFSIYNVHNYTTN